MNNHEVLLKQLLKQQMVLLNKAEGHLEYSLERVERINLETSLNNEKLEILDSFATRFLRLYEMLINQNLRTCLQLLGEYKKTIIDNINKAESLEMITSADQLNYIRMLRIKVAHEYVEDEWKKIYQEIIEYASHLLTSCNKLKSYIDERNWLK